MMRELPGVNSWIVPAVLVVDGASPWWRRHGGRLGGGHGRLGMDQRPAA